MAEITTTEKPAQVAKGEGKPPVPSPRSGFVPPVEHRWQAGKSGNPSGRPRAGAAVEEWLNLLAHDQDMSPQELERIAKRDKRPARRAAATQILLSGHAGDIADYAPFLEGRMTLEELKKAGVGTYGVKSARIRKTVDANGEPVETREIELYDRSGAAFDRVMDRTVGKSREQRDISLKVEHITPTPIIHLPDGFRPMPLPGMATTIAQASDEELEHELRRRGRLIDATPATPALPTDQAADARS